MNTTASTQAPAPVTPQRRFDDHALPDRPLEWDVDGTPLEATSVVYLYRPRAEQFKRWAEIHTQEHLLDVQAAPERYELRTLFTVPVDDLVRAPITTIAIARQKLDTIQAATSAVIANMRAFAREIAELP
jgi:hypothetical protein